MFPSQGLIKVCCQTETVIKQIMFVTNNSLPSQSLLPDITALVTSKLADNMNTIFGCTHSEHNYKLVKEIIYCYCKIRIHNLAKKFTEKIQGDLVRTKLNKLILFCHQ